MPFPHTSPTATTSRSSDTRRTSKRSPPTCRAGSMVAWMSRPRPRLGEARSEGRMPIWISRAMARSRSCAARIASAYALALSSERTRAFTSRISNGLVR